MKASARLFGTFPRQMSFPYRIVVHSSKEMVKSINRMNGHSPIFTSLYQLIPDATEFVHALDKVFFDQDSDADWAAGPTRKLSDAALNHSVQHGIVRSGGGFHQYVMAEPHQLEHPGGAIWHFQNWLVKEANIDFVEGGAAGGVDSAVHGNVAQCVRIPGTWNTKRKVMSGYIKADDWLTGEPATPHQNLDTSDWLLPGNPVDLRSFDKPKPFDDAKAIKLDIDGASASVQLEYNCVKDFAANPEANNAQRYVMATHVIEMGHTYEDLDAFMREHLSAKKYKHAVQSEGNAFKRMFKEERPMPGCGWIRRAAGFPESACEGCPKWGQS